MMDLYQCLFGVEDTKKTEKQKFREFVNKVYNYALLITGGTSVVALINLVVISSFESFAWDWLFGLIVNGGCFILTLYNKRSYNELNLMLDYLDGEISEKEIEPLMRKILRSQSPTSLKR